MPHAGAEEISWESLGVEELATLASTASLLGDTRSFVLSGALAGDRGEEFLELAEGLMLSPHNFFFEEEKLLKYPTEVLEKTGAKIEKHAIEKKESFDVFSLANMFAARDKKKMWLLTMKALRAGVAPEAIVGMLHWKVRDLLSKLPAQAGKFSRKELVNTSRELVTIYHDSHRGVGELSLLLERFVLNM